MLTQLEKAVLDLEAGNLSADDSEIKQRFDHQRQLNIQLQEQKRWLEHELEQIKLKIQNERMSEMPDPFSLDWYVYAAVSNITKHTLKNNKARPE